MSKLWLDSYLSKPGPQLNALGRAAQLIQQNAVPVNRLGLFHHWRTVANSKLGDNYSSFPNVNPYTGKLGGRRLTQADIVKGRVW